MPIKKIKSLIKITIVTLLVFGNIRVLALQTESNTDGTSTEMAEGPCGTGEGCGNYSNYFHVRITMVDRNKKIVEGTKIIELMPISESDGLHVMYRENKNEYTSSDVNGGPDSNYVFIGSSVVAGGENINNINTNVRGEIAMYNAYLGFNPDDGETIEQQRSKFIKYLSTVSSKKSIVNGQKVGLLELILNINGWSDNSDQKYTLTTEELIKIKENEYYLIIENVYEVGTNYYNEYGELDWHNTVGTAKQLARYYYNNYYNNIAGEPFYDKLWIAYTDGFAYNAACNFIDESNFLEINFGNKNELCGDFSVTAKDKSVYELNEKYFGKISLSNSRFGINVVKLLQGIEISENNYTCEYKYNACKNDSFKFSLQLNMEDMNKTIYSNKESVRPCIEHNDMAFERRVTDTVSLKCYDNFEYDFSSLKRLENQMYISNQLVEVPTGSMTIDRTCYVVGENAKTINETLIRDQMIQINNENFENPTFLFKFNDKSYIFEQDNTTKKVSESVIGGEKNTFNKYKNKYIQTTISYEYKLATKQGVYNSQDLLIDNDLFMFNKNIKEDNSMFFENVDSNSSVIIVPNTDDYSKQFNNSIAVSGTTIGNGLNASIIRYLENNGTHKITESTEKNKTGTIIFIKNNITYEFEKNETKCEFETYVENTGVLTGDGVKFRIISLSNPFPARDGRSRLPGTNWLNNTNYVYNSIINNRGVQYLGKYDNSYLKMEYSNGEKSVNPETMYSKLEPMYTITLDPSTMMKLRQYNKGRTYSDIELECNEENRECVSKILRNEEYIPEDNLGGACSDSRNYHIMTETYPNITKDYLESKIYGSTNYINTIDFNKNGMMDTEDIEIFDNKEKNTNFYTCANKTYKSGG